VCTAGVELPQFETNHKQMIFDFQQLPISRLPEEQIVITNSVKKGQLLRVYVRATVRPNCNPSHYMTLNPACQFVVCCTSVCQNSMLSFLYPDSDEAS
jgi:hypothetical protein